MHYRALYYASRDICTKALLKFSCHLIYWATSGW